MNIKESEIFEHDETNAYWDCPKCGYENNEYGMRTAGDYLECSNCGLEVLILND